MLLRRHLASTERVLVDLVLDLRRRVRHEDARRILARRHLALRAEERRDELGVNERRLFVLEASRHFAREPEVGILVDRAGDEARDVGLGAEDLGERVGEGRGGLNRDKVPLADVVAVRREGQRAAREAGREGDVREVEAKGLLGLASGD